MDAESLLRHGEFLRALARSHLRRWTRSVSSAARSKMPPGTSVVRRASGRISTASRRCRDEQSGLGLDSEIETFALGSLGEVSVERHEREAIRSIRYRHQGGSELQRIRRAQRMN